MDSPKGLIITVAVLFIIVIILLVWLLRGEGFLQPKRTVIEYGRQILIEPKKPGDKYLPLKLEYRVKPDDVDATVNRLQSDVRVINDDMERKSINHSDLHILRSKSAESYRSYKKSNPGTPTSMRVKQAEFDRGKKFE